MDKGWIKLHRILLDNPIIKKANYLALWIVLLLKANHSPQRMIWNGHTIIVKEGQLISGRKELSKQTNIPETTIERILNYLENEHQIGQQKTTKYRLITILNWDEYQNRTLERTTNGQQTDTNKNVKNVKNTSESKDSPVIVISENEEEPRTKTKPKYPNSRTVFGWFPHSEKSWVINTTECKHAELLFERGEKQVRAALRFVGEHKEDDYFPKIVKPSDLERKWQDILDFKKKNNL